MPKKKTAPEVSGKLLDKVDQKIEANVSTEADQTPQTPPHPKETIPSRETTVGQSDILQDKKTDQAVDDIAAKEADTMLALQDALGRKASHIAGDLAQRDRHAARRRKWAWFIFFVAFVILVLLALPLTTYTCRWPAAIRLSVTTDILPSVCK
ncbi:MAG TPA: hypothetical protein VFH99_03245 [Candidatus Saccharimonadales bacterium]|nr:hypothetical protein [Candidatus Saccharimonadales bacterium]